MPNIDPTTLKEVFRSAPFIADLGIEPESAGGGECVTTLQLERRHLQQNGYVHAGVLATMADHSAGAAAFTICPGGSYVLTVEFKLSLLRAAQGERIVCRAKVLKPGKQFSFVESEVFCVASGQEKLVAKASATIAILSAG